MEEREYCALTAKTYVEAAQKMLSEAGGYIADEVIHHDLATAFNALVLVQETLKATTKIKPQVEAESNEAADTYGFFDSNW